MKDLLYVGCYTAETDGSGLGIMAVSVDPATGDFTGFDVAAACPSPSFVTRHPQLPVLYAANELGGGEVSAWGITAPGVLRELGSQPTGGAHPCHLHVHHGFLVTVNYTGGSVAVHPINPDGSLGPRTDLRQHSGNGPRADRQEGPHPHMVRPTHDGSHLLVVDLGTDQVHHYDVDGGGRIVVTCEPTQVSPGTGPRHLALSPQGRWHLVGELDGTVSVGETLDDRLPTSTSAVPRQASEVAVSADGRRLYVANRGPDTIGVLALDRDEPALIAEVPTGGAWPRHFAIDGDLLYVANERSHNVVSFRLDSDGIPRATGYEIELGSPTSILPA